MQGLFHWVVNGESWGFVNYVTFMPVLPATFWATCAALAEFFGGILVFVGYRTRLASLSLGFVMIVALFGVHVPKGLQPDVGLMGEIEFPLALLAMAVCLILTGPGRFSITLKK